jgi:hypothetical protein
MTIEIATYVKEFEDYTNGYEDIPAPAMSIEKEKEKLKKLVSKLERKTANVSITQKKTNKKAFGEEGTVYRRIAIITQKIAGSSNLKECNLLEVALTELGYKKIGL